MARRALRRARFRRGGRVFRRGAAAAGLALVIALGACTPAIETWREVSGVAKNDPDPVNAPFTRNLAAGETAPYPNLASVPPPPTRATTTAERQKLAQSLIADRAATEAAAGPRPTMPTPETAGPPRGAAPLGPPTPGRPSTAPAGPG